MGNDGNHGLLLFLYFLFFLLLVTIFHFLKNSLISVTFRNYEKIDRYCDTTLGADFLLIQYYMSHTFVWASAAHLFLCKGQVTNCNLRVMLLSYSFVMFRKSERNVGFFYVWASSSRCALWSVFLNLLSMTFTSSGILSGGLRVYVLLAGDTLTLTFECWLTNL